MSHGEDDGEERAAETDGGGGSPADGAHTDMRGTTDHERQGEEPRAQARGPRGQQPAQAHPCRHRTLTLCDGDNEMEEPDSGASGEQGSPKPGLQTPLLADPGGKAGKPGVSTENWQQSLHPTLKEHKDMASSNGEGHMADKGRSKPQSPRALSTLDPTGKPIWQNAHFTGKT